MAKSKGKRIKTVFAGKRRPHKKAKVTPPIPCLYMGKKYESFTAAAKDTGKSRTFISRTSQEL